MRHVLGWAAFEAHINHLLSLSPTIASGSQPHDPGDGVDRRHYHETDYALQVDAKYTIKGSFAVNRAFMRKSWERAANAGKAFALPIRFADEHTGTVEDYVVLPLDDYVGLLQAHRDGERAVREGDWA